MAAWGTFISGVVGVLGLIAATLSTYVAFGALEDQRELQREQEREQEQRERIAQATRVTMWYEYSMESPRAVITIANRSLDPLTDVSSGFLYEGGYEEGESLGWEVAVTANIESFPPCSEVAIHGQRLAEESGYLQIDVMPEFSIAETASSIIPGEIPLAFTDAAGRSWMRSQEGLQEGDWIVLPGAGSGVEVQRPEVEFTSLSAAQCD